MRWRHADTSRTVNITVELELTAVIPRRRVSITVDLELIAIMSRRRVSIIAGVMVNSLTSSLLTSRPRFVAGKKFIEVRNHQGATAKAQIIKVGKKRDLALLQLYTDLNLVPLQLGAEPPPVVEAASISISEQLLNAA